MLKAWVTYYPAPEAEGLWNGRNNEYLCDTCGIIMKRDMPIFQVAITEDDSWYHPAGKSLTYHCSEECAQLRVLQKI